MKKMLGTALVYTRRRSSTNAITMRPKFASLNSLPEATKIAPSTKMIVAKRKYPPSARKKVKAPGGAARGLTDGPPVLNNDPRKRANGA